MKAIDVKLVRAKAKFIKKSGVTKSVWAFGYTISNLTVRPKGC
jgi:hypothetical protein